jgi:hypothetical protein
LTESPASIIYSFIVFMISHVDLNLVPAAYNLLGIITAIVDKIVRLYEDQVCHVFYYIVKA